MHFRPDEKILKTYHHHPFPYIIRVLKIVLSSVPFYLLLFLLRSSLDTSTFVISGFVITGIFLLVLLYDGVLYWLDRLIVTNYRLIHVHWPFFTLKREFEAEIADIQDVEIREQGVFSYIKIFDFGEFKIQTAASRVTILFPDAPDPEEIEHFVLSVQKYH